MLAMSAQMEPDWCVNMMTWIPLSGMHSVTRLVRGYHAAAKIFSLALLWRGSDGCPRSTQQTQAVRFCVTSQ